MKKEFIAIFDNLVTDDLIMRNIRAESIGEAYDIALEISKGTGLSVGNFSLYIDVCNVEKLIKESGEKNEI